MISKEDKTCSLRERPGTIKINSRLISFLYQLMRDNVPVGTIEQVTQDSEDHLEVVFTNGWLAKYAEDVAKRLEGK